MNKPGRVASGYLPADLKIKQLTGFRENEYRPWEETILDTVDSLLAIEKVDEIDIPTYVERIVNFQTL
jgi:hypothetical protein